MASTNPVAISNRAANAKVSAAVIEAASETEAVEAVAEVASAEAAVAVVAAVASVIEVVEAAAEADSAEVAVVVDREAVVRQTDRVCSNLGSLLSSAVYCVPQLTFVSLSSLS